MAEKHGGEKMSQGLEKREQMCSKQLQTIKWSIDWSLEEADFFVSL